MRKHQDVLVCFPSYAFSVPGADGDPIGEIKSPSRRLVEKFATYRSKALDFEDCCTNNAVIDCTYVLVDKSEQAEEGARSFLLLWLV